MADFLYIPIDPIKIKSICNELKNKLEYYYLIRTNIFRVYKNSSERLTKRIDCGWP